MPTPSNAKIQHYVPQFLLRSFGDGRKHQLHVFDKQTSCSFKTNARNIAGESYFYDFCIEHQEATLEPTLAQLESATKPLLKRILQRDSASVVDDAERKCLCDFLAVQFTRTKAFREQILDLSRVLGDHLRTRSGAEGDLGDIEQLIKLPNENELKIQTAHFITESPKDLGPHFRNKDWLLIATTHEAPFIIGDNPLTLQNAVDTGPYGNRGLAVKGIEVYLPLSPTRALALWCPSHKEALLATTRLRRHMRKFAPHLLTAKSLDFDAAEQVERALLEGKPLQYSPDNVRNFNSLQVSHAERFVFSCNPDFALARDMVSTYPALRNGPRVRSN